MYCPDFVDEARICVPRDLDGERGGGHRRTWQRRGDLGRGEARAALGGQLRPRPPAVLGCTVPYGESGFAGNYAAWIPAAISILAVVVGGVVGGKERHCRDRAASVGEDGAAP